MPDLFTRLASAMRPGEGLLFSLNALTGDRIEVLVQPKLPEATDLPDDAARIRAALAMPLRLTGTPAEVSDLFADHLQAFQTARADAADALGDLLQTLKQVTGEARKQAATAPAPTTSKIGAAAKPAPSAEPASEPAPAPVTTNPPSLF